MHILKATSKCVKQVTRTTFDVLENYQIYPLKIYN